MSGTLPSGLPAVVGDSEDLARFVFSSGQYRRSDLLVKPAAFLPRNGQTSVSRHGPDPRDGLWALAPRREGQSLKGATIIKAGVVQENTLDLHADDIPPRHANIVGWPAEGTDAMAAKARCMELAASLASKAAFIPADPSPWTRPPSP